mmetsp:Transcript_49252/g.106679  ORF Transcript_49252/g.106679 Transcript_49252/m.106679 type:complete len:944 (+) Transcript_49252:765-3596(+)
MAAGAPSYAGSAGGRASASTLRLFNSAKSGEKAVAALLSQGLLGSGSAVEVAQFLLANDGKLDASKVGDFLGGHEPLNQQALRIIMESLSFRKLPLDSALRLMISFIKLPGEAQKIDRIIEAFAHQYTECNPGVLDHPDTAVIIAFSLAMLNTDAHNPAIKKERKMTLQQYRAQLRDCCKNGSPPDQEMLKGFYERVTRFEWQVEEKKHMRRVRQGWLSKASSSKKPGKSSKRLYCIMSPRGLYFYQSEREPEPCMYIRLEGMRCRPHPRGFEMRPLHPVEGKDTGVRMVKIVQTVDGPKQEPSKNSSFVFSAESDKEAKAWIATIRDHTIDDDEENGPPPEPPRRSLSFRKRKSSFTTKAEGSVRAQAAADQRGAADADDVGRQLSTSSVESPAPPSTSVRSSGSAKHPDVLPSPSTDGPPTPADSPVTHSVLEVLAAADANASEIPAAAASSTSTTAPAASAAATPAAAASYDQDGPPPPQADTRKQAFTEAASSPPTHDPPPAHDPPPPTPPPPITVSPSADSPSPPSGSPRAHQNHHHHLVSPRQKQHKQRSLKVGRKGHSEDLVNALRRCSLSDVALEEATSARDKELRRAASVEAAVDSARAAMADAWRAKGQTTHSNGKLLTANGAAALSPKLAVCRSELHQLNEQIFAERRTLLKLLTMQSELADVNPSVASLPLSASRHVDAALRQLPASHKHDGRHDGRHTDDDDVAASRLASVFSVAERHLISSPPKLSTWRSDPVSQQHAAQRALLQRGAVFLKWPETSADTPTASVAPTPYFFWVEPNAPDVGPALAWRAPPSSSSPNAALALLAVQSTPLSDFETVSDGLSDQSAHTATDFFSGLCRERCWSIRTPSTTIQLLARDEAQRAAWTDAMRAVAKMDGQAPPKTPSSANSDKVRERLARARKASASARAAERPNSAARASTSLRPTPEAVAT